MLQKINTIAGIVGAVAGIVGTLIALATYFQVSIEIEGVNTRVNDVEKVVSDFETLKDDNIKNLVKSLVKHSERKIHHRTH